MSRIFNSTPIGDTTMAQHKASLEKTLQSALKHKEYGSRMAETVASIESIAIVLATAADGPLTDYSTDSQDSDSIRRMRVGIAHASYGKRIQDAYETLAAIDAGETPTGTPFTSAEISLDGQHKQDMEKTCQSAMASKAMGTRLAEMASKQDQILDGLITDHALNPLTLAALVAIRDA